jgi:hypothetical protein
MYLRKDGCFEFQIDLAQALINYALEHEWEDLDGPGPNWMRQKEFLPRDCKKCFFCRVKGLTNGISHKRKAKTIVVESKKKRHVIVGHTNFRVKWGKKGSSYCRMCYRYQKGAVGADGKKLIAEEKKNKCN